MLDYLVEEHMQAQRKKFRFGKSSFYHPRFIKKGSLKNQFLKTLHIIDATTAHYYFIKIIKKHLNKLFQAPCRVLDAGCGDGQYSFWLSRQFPNSIIDACDISKTKIYNCKKIQQQIGAENISFFIKDLKTYKNEEKYDFIFSNHVLEHVVDNKLVIKNLVASLKDGGYIYVQIPNAIQKRIINKKYLITLENWEKKEHIGQTLNLNTLSSELKKRGCKILIAKHTRGFWGELSYEILILTLGYFNRYFLYVLLLPIILVLGFFDTFHNYKNGNEILVLARKATKETSLSQRF